ncbi:MAG: A/G-specific adenine glycosylase [Candidatus Tokpelaia hoelldobleri]|uniref:Adenine DNA glycosylase n=1 Tax=Candidatus Tokpelaia hoelldobleri TaxID=1902579 RepID=A0A1U9JW54_9HYPH|nr:MAG: A/G-specific adenine glycosylase [Candidatus Tokpelaia hoelldoblerii]
MTDTASLLLNWYDKHHRILPWRITPAEQARGMAPDPYRVWLSEVMLQQTTVEAVKAYFNKFTSQWPDISALAGASQDDILRAWAGLGYYSRARNLKACADKIMAGHGGVFPRELAGLRALPGIGDYTAAAIAAIAFNLPHAVVDGNVERVVSRLFCLTTPLPAAKAEIRIRTQGITPAERPGDFAQSMMDLGATICTPKRPSCFLCPLNEHCLALKNDEPQRLPLKAPKAEKPLRTGMAFVAISENSRVYLQKRPEKGLLGGMSEVPNYFAPGADKADLSRAPFATDWRYQGDITHVFTHFTLVLAIYRADNLPEHSDTGGWWVAVDKLKGEALPTVIKKAVAQVLPTAFNNTERKPADRNA